VNVLAFDTCLGAVSVAFRHRTADGSWAVVEACETREARHAERLMPMIADVLAEAGATFASVGRVAVTLGPGTFTGVRTGIAAARAFRLAAEVEVVGLTSLAVIAHGAFRQVEMADGRGLLVASDARRGMVYAQLFDSNALDALAEPVEATPAAVLALAAGRPLLAVGSGAALVARAASEVGADVRIALEAIEPQARDLAELAPGLAVLGEVKPIYLRPPDAKPQTGKTLARAP
jgi:tRNA threonylcarbamoyladenosine biosynthesis protein TsaB